jgi:formylmethanofuran dehydrogenase subunit B
VFWGVDPSLRYPRFLSRYAPEPAGLHVPAGRSARTVIAIDIDDARGPEDADIRVAVPAAMEVATLSWLTALAAQPPGNPATEPPSDPATQIASHPATQPPTLVTPRAIAQDLLPALLAGRYLSLVADAEPGSAPEGAKGATAVAGPSGGLPRASALIALAQALNGPTRCALTSLRAGGNRSGADAALTSQTGYPAAVDFSRGYPRYRPYDSGRLASGVDAVLVVGSLALVPAPVRELIGRVAAAIIGPRASDAPPPHAQAVIDAGTAGIHCGGTALRMDDVPLPLRRMVPGAPDPAVLIRGLRDRLFLLPLAAGRS